MGPDTTVTDRTYSLGPQEREPLTQEGPKVLEDCELPEAPRVVLTPERMSLLSGGTVSRSGAGFPAELRAGESQAGDPSVSRIQPSPQGRQPRRAALQMLSGYFILFYISGDKNWFLMWSYAFQVATSLPAPATLGGVWVEKEGRVVARRAPLTQSGLQGQPRPCPPGLGDRRSPVQPSGLSV